MSLFDLFSSDNEAAAAEARKRGLQSGYEGATGAIDTGLGNLKTQYGQAIDYFSPLAKTAGGGYGAYGDATGASGPDGLARALELFKQTPGYQEGLNTTLDQLDRRMAGRGMLASGNTLDATAKTATDYANQKYGDYVSRLQPFLGEGRNIAGAQAGLTAGVGDKEYGAGVIKGDYGWRNLIGQGDADAAYELSKDQTGLNQLSGIFNGLGMASKLFGFM